MREIKKRPEPRELTQYRSNGGHYNGPNFTPVKNAIRESLLREQGYLCAYCMARITLENMKVEHWACQANNSQLQLTYSNLLGCCMGGEGEKLENQTCDSRKGNKILKFNPSRAQDRITTLIKYNGQGKIYSTDEEFSTQINTVLNLNKIRLVENRSHILKSLRSELESKGRTCTRSEIRRLFDRNMALNSSGHLKAYCGLIEYYLSPRL
ncbi:retron system putative HNH endonuclease [Rahnella inusitata]|uniref:retron system putative HNH endonuclease n=1 Tax=Rahnella inusitata TaxID=58169 RepID=UPI0039BEC07F